MSRVCSAALDAAAAIIAAATGADVGREPLGPDEGDAQDGVEVVLALSEGDQTELERLLGSAGPFDFEHHASFEILLSKGAQDDRRAKRDEIVMAAAVAIAADPTLGGLVDFAELTAPDTTIAQRFLAMEATLSITYSAPTALG